MTDDSRAKEIMNYSFLVAFANDGVISMAELGFIKRLALRDGVLDEQEKQVLSKVFERIKLEETAPEVNAEIASFRKEYNF